MAVDATYPLYPVASILSSGLLLLVLATAFIRQRWNIAVSSLCFWLFLENLANGINGILWADNADIKAEVYCDIVTRIQMFASILKPACSLAITRRLYKIASMRSVDMDGVSKRSKRVDRFVDVFLVLVLPAVVAGPFYYIVQDVRFQVIEGFGCNNSFIFDGVSILLLKSWSLTLPLISMLFYIPKIIWTFSRLKRQTREFFDSNNVLSRNFYFRILSLGCFDILFTLPIGIANMVISVRATYENDEPTPFYWGWDDLHSDWSPSSTSYAEYQAFGTWFVADEYLQLWFSIVLGFIIFGFFGLSYEARKMYRTWYYRVTGLTPPVKNTALSTISFGARKEDTVQDIEQSAQLSFDGSQNEQCKEGLKYAEEDAGVMSQLELEEDKVAVLSFPVPLKSR